MVSGGSSSTGGLADARQLEERDIPTLDQCLNSEPPRGSRVKWRVAAPTGRPPSIVAQHHVAERRRLGLPGEGPPGVCWALRLARHRQKFLLGGHAPPPRDDRVAVPRARACRRSGPRACQAVAAQAAERFESPATRRTSSGATPASRRPLAAPPHVSRELGARGADRETGAEGAQRAPAHAAPRRPLAPFALRLVGKRSGCRHRDATFLRSWPE